MSEKPAPESPVTKKKASPASNPLIILTASAFLLALISISLVFFQKTQYKQLNNQLKSFQIKTIANTQSNQEQLLQQNQHIQTLQTALSNVSENNDHSLITRALFNISYLIHTAHFILATTKNNSQAINALTLALSITQKNDLSDFLSLQQSLSEDIAALRKRQAAFNPNALILQLSDFQHQLAAASFDHKKQFTPQDQGSTTPPLPNKHWYSPITQIAHRFKGLIIIRHHNNNLPPIFSQNQINTVKETLLLKLSLAQWALTQHNIKIFRHDIQFSKQWLNRLAPLNPKMQSMIASLNKINTETTSTPEHYYPLTSLTIINEILSQHANISPTPQKTNQTIIQNKAATKNKEMVK